MNQYSISKRGLDLVKEFEGYHRALPNGDCEAYLDTLPTKPLWTCGWGCTKGVTKDTRWTRAQAEQELRSELAEHEARVRRIIKVELNQHQFDALVSIDYNLIGGLDRCPTLVGAVNRGDFKAAAEAFLLYSKAGGKTYNGLLRRRKAERALFLTLPKKEVVQNSTKLTLLKRLRLFIQGLIPAGGLAEWLGYLEPIKAFATENWHWILLGLVASIWLLSKWIEFKSIQDHNQGNYTPSKAADEPSAPDGELDTSESSVPADCEDGECSPSST